MGWLKEVALFGLSAGLTAAAMEAGASWYFDGAFPHLNVYRADPELGARLQPGETQRLAFAGNPPTAIRINDWGYRGGGWDASEAGQILVVGDSQVFGLGVEEDATFSAVLAQRLGRPVRNAGVPTYGPQEYAAVAEELLGALDVSAVIAVINLYNDLFEATLDNRHRHVIWDGWAVRSETAPAEVFEFPGRRRLFRSSHLLFLARRTLHRWRAPLDEQALPSEGSWPALVALAGESATQGAAQDAERQARLEAMRLQLADAEAALDVMVSSGRAPLEIPYGQRMDWDARDAHPGDIVRDRYAEAARSVEVTAEMIQRGAALRERLLEAAAAAGGTPAETAARYREAREVLEGAPEPLVISPVHPHLLRLAAACRAAGAQLVVVALPMDVQVSPGEWAKYDLATQDMSPTLALNADVLAAAEAVGALGFDALPPLAAASPGAFLAGDLHMTPAGHRALGEALADSLVGAEIP